MRSVWESHRKGIGKARIKYGRRTKATKGAFHFIRKINAAKRSGQIKK
jgi:hypothetical protein